MNASALKALIDLRYPNNSTGMITPSGERETLKAIVDFVNASTGVVDVERVINPGTLTFNSSTSATLTGASWANENGEFEYSGPVTLTANHATLDRIDLIVGMNEDSIQVVTGTASENPVFPSIPMGGVLLQTVLRNAGSGSVANPSASNNQAYATKFKAGGIGEYALVWETILSPNQSYLFQLWYMAFTSDYFEGGQRPLNGVLKVAFTAKTAVAELDLPRVSITTSDKYGEPGDFVLQDEGSGKVRLYIKKTAWNQFAQFHYSGRFSTVTPEMLVNGSEYAALPSSSLRRESITEEASTDFSNRKFYKNFQDALYTRGPKDIIIDSSGDLIVEPEFMGNLVFTKGPVNVRAVVSAENGDEEFTMENSTGVVMTVQADFSGAPANSAFAEAHTINPGEKKAFKSNGVGKWIEGVVNDVAFSDHLDSVNAQVSVGSDGLKLINNVFDYYTKESIVFKEIGYIPDNIDGVSIIKLGDTYYKRLADRIDIISFGLKGNGSVENPDLLHNALRYGKLLIKGGTFLFSAPVNYSLPNRIDIVAENGAKFKVNTVGFGVHIANSPSLKISGLSFENNMFANYGDSSYGFRAINCQNVFLNNISTINSGLILQNCEDGEIQLSKVVNAPYMGMYLQNCKRFDVFNKNHINKAVNGYRTEGCEDIRIFGNESEDVYSLCARIEDSKNVKLTGNTFKNCNGAYSIYGPKSGGWNEATSNIEITGNTFIDCFASKTVVYGFNYVLGHVGIIGRTSASVDGALIDGNFLVNTREAQSFIDYESGETVVFNESLSGYSGGVFEDINGNSSYVVDRNSKYVEWINAGSTRAVDWLFYINLPSPVDLSERRFSIDIWADFNGVTQNNDWTVNLYNSVDRNGLIATIPFDVSNITRTAVPTLIVIPPDVNASNVACIEILNNRTQSGNIRIGKFHDILGARIGYLHNLSSSADIKNIKIGENSYKNVPQPIYIKNSNSAPPIVTDQSDETVNLFPLFPAVGRRIFRNGGPLWWDGNKWNNWKKTSYRGTSINTRSGVIRNLEGGQFASVSGTSIGAISISLPATISGRIQVKGSVMRMSGAFFQFTAIGQITTGSWSSASVNIAGGSSIEAQTFRFSHKDGRHIISIGETSTNWGVLGVVIDNVLVIGGPTAQSEPYDEEWDVYLESEDYGDVASTVTANPLATTLQRGIVELATNAETIAGTDTERAVTPAGLAATILKATAPLDFPSIPAGESATLTATVTGAAGGDPVIVGTSSSVYAANNSTVEAWVSSTDTVTIRVRNNGASAIDPGSVNFNIRVFK